MKVSHLIVDMVMYRFCGICPSPQKFALDRYNPLNWSKKRKAIIGEIGSNGVVHSAILDALGADFSNYLYVKTRRNS